MDSAWTTSFVAEWPYPYWVAHRGAGKTAPENTLAAFRLGASLGFQMFECDVTLSADGEAYLLHDPELDRTTDGRGVAVRQTWAELSCLDAGSWHSAPYAGEPLLRLGALARWLQANHLMVNLEIKPGPDDDVRCGEVVANEVARLWMGAAVPPLLSSFQIDALRAAKLAQPELPRALLLEAWVDDWRSLVKELDCVALVVHHPHWTAERIDKVHRAGLKALTYTVNDPERARELAQAGLDGLITDQVREFEPLARSGQRF